MSTWVAKRVDSFFYVFGVLENKRHNWIKLDSESIVSVIILVRENRPYSHIWLFIFQNFVKIYKIWIWSREILRPEIVINWLVWQLWNKCIEFWRIGHYAFSKFVKIGIFFVSLTTVFFCVLGVLENKRQNWIKFDPASSSWSDAITNWLVS